MSQRELQSAIASLQTDDIVALNASYIERNVEKVLDNVISLQDLSEKMLRSVATTLRDICILYPRNCQIFLQSFDMLPDVQQFLDFVPAMFSMASEEAICMVVEKLTLLVQHNDIFLVQVVRFVVKLERTLITFAQLTVITELPTSPYVVEAVTSLVHTSLSTIREDDYPNLFRVTLKILSECHNDDLLTRVRQEVTNPTFFSFAAFQACLQWH